MVYGVLKLINFAHGDVYMVGAYAGFYLANALGIDENPSLAKAGIVFVGSMAICGALGVTIERFAYRPLRQRPRLTALITAIGVSLLLEFGFQLPSIPHLGIPFPPGPTPRFFPDVLTRVDWEPGGVHISNYDVISLAVAVGLMLALQYIVYRTRFGTSMRAVSFDAQVAGLMGINVNKVISYTFILGSALAGAPPRRPPPPPSPPPPPPPPPPPRGGGVCGGGCWGGGGGVGGGRPPPPGGRQ